MKINYSIIFVSDMARSVAFYRDVLGIPLKYETPGWSEFVTEGATLALHASEAGSTNANTDRKPRAGQCRAGFNVEDLDAFHARMGEHSVECAQEPTETYGVWIAQYVDPDGLVFSVSGARSSA